MSPMCPMRCLLRGARALAFLGLLAAPLSVQAEEKAKMPGLTTIETVCADRDATGYATFQSNNQKVVSNRRGLFMAYIRSRNEPYTAQQWRLVRSTDGGKTWATLYEATHATNPPVLETDEQDNVYLVRPDFDDGHAYLYRFHAANDYKEPLVSRIPNGSAGKFCMCFDPGRKQLYYFPHNDTFHVVGLDGTVRLSYRILQPGANAALQYPQLSLDRDGTLYAAWTTVKNGVYLYWDIHYMLSRDGGKSWQKLDGTPLTLPVVADNGGAADGIIRDDEYESHTWLSSFLVKAGKLHFVYEAQMQPLRQHYLRYDLQSGRRDVDLCPELRGKQISVAGLDGFLAARAPAPDSTLYLVHNMNGRIACLASDDNGASWYDYALSDSSYAAYAISGCREITADGYVIGHFTHQAAVAAEGILAKCPVYFLKIRAGLSRARVDGVGYADGTARLRFEDVRGQPAAVRLRAATGRWTPWQPFQGNLSARIPLRPAHFQLRSRLGVAAEPVGLGNGG